jgi:hypothetical protein
MKSLKGLADDFKDLLGDKDKDKEKEKEKQRDQHQQDSHAQQGGYGGGPPGQHQNYHPPQQGSYGGSPPGGPQLPPGWLQQWDQNSQR